MTYSFSIKAATKAEAKDAVAKYFDESVIAFSSVHARDRSAVLANANAVIDLLADDETKDIHCSVNGFVSGNWNADSTYMYFSGLSIATSAGHVTREEGVKTK